MVFILVTLSLCASIPLSIKGGLIIAPHLKVLVRNELVPVKGFKTVPSTRKCSVSASSFILTAAVLVVHPSGMGSVRLQVC